MDSAISDLVVLGLYGLGGVAVVGLVVWRVVAMGHAASAPLSNEQCVACGSKDVTALAAGVYRCNGCGYEGGSGVAAAMAEREWAEVSAMSPEARRAGAVADLREALAVLVAADGRLGGLAPDSTDVDAARSELLRAGEALRRAGLKLGHPILAPQLATADSSGFAMATVTDALGGAAGVGWNAATAAMTAAEASGLRGQARAMAAAAQAALVRTGGLPS